MPPPPPASTPTVGAAPCKSAAATFAGPLISGVAQFERPLIGDLGRRLEMIDCARSARGPRGIGCGQSKERVLSERVGVARARLLSPRKRSAIERASPLSSQVDPLAAPIGACGPTRWSAFLGARCAGCCAGCCTGCCTGCSARLGSARLHRVAAGGCASSAESRPLWRHFQLATYLH